MREFTKVSPLVWRSKKFKKLEPADQLIYLYFLTSPHANSIGCYVIPLAYIGSDLGMGPADVRKGIERVCESLLIGYDFDEELVLVHNFITFNAPTNPNHAKMMQKEADGLPEINLKIVVIKILKEFCSSKGWDLVESVSKDYQKTIKRVSPPDQTRPDQTKTPTARKDFGVLPLANGSGSGRFDVREYLDENSISTAKRNAPGWDVNGHLANVYNSGINDGYRERPINPAAAFPVWCAKYTKGKKP